MRRRGTPVVLVDGGTGGLNLLNAFEGASRIEIFDAVQSGGRPGDVYRIPATQIEAWPARSSHDFGIEQVLRLYFETCPNPLPPEDIVLYGVEVSQMVCGEGVSPAVQAACDRLFDHVKGEFDPWQ